MVTVPGLSVPCVLGTPIIAKSCHSALERLVVCAQRHGSRAAEYRAKRGKKSIRHLNEKNHCIMA